MTANQEERIADQKLRALLNEVEYILTIEHRKSRGLILSEETVEMLRSAYIDYERCGGRDESSLAELRGVFLLEANDEEGSLEANNEEDNYD